MIVAPPVTPVMVLGPVAVRLTELAATVPPWVLEMVLTKVSVGNLSLVKVQFTTAPAGKPAAAISTNPLASVLVVLPTPAPEHTMFDSA